MSYQPLDPDVPIDPFNTVNMTGLDQQTGMYFDADATNSSILLKTAGTPAMYIDKFQNMGINTLSPSAQLDVNSASSAHIQLTYNGSSTAKANIGVSSDGKLLLAPGGSEVSIDAAASLNIKSHDGANMGLLLNNALVRATADQLNYTIVSPGTASNNKALVVGSTGSIAGINSLSAVALTGTLQTAYQPNVTSVDTMDVTAHDGITGLKLGGAQVAATAAELNYTHTTAGTAEASKALVLDASRDIINIHKLKADNLEGTLLTAAQPNVTSLGTLTGLQFDGPLTGLTELSIDTEERGRTLVISDESGNTLRMFYDAATDTTKYVDMLVSNTGDLVLTSAGGNVDVTTHNGATAGLKLGGTLVTASADQVNYLQGTTPGAVTTGKAMVVDANRNIGNINALTATSLTGTLQTAAQPNVSSVSVLDITTHDGGNVGLKLGGTLVTATADEINYVDTTQGHAQASKAAVFDADKNIDGIASLSATSLTGTLQTAAQPNVTSVGTLSSLAVAGDVTVGATTLSEAEVAVLDTVVPGTVLASHAVVVDENKDISAFRNLTATNVTGTLQTAAQPNVTSVTTLNLTGHDGAAAGLALGGTLVTATAAEINYVDTTQGHAQASKALVVDVNRDIDTIHSLTADNLTGTLRTAAQPNVTSVGTLSSLAVAGDVTVGATTLSEAEVGVLDGVTPGIVSASKALVVDANKNIATLNSVSATTVNAGDVVATNVTGTLQTAAQPNVTSVTTLDITGHDGTTAGLSLGGTLLTATAEELNSIFGAGGEGTFNNLTVNDTLTLGGADGSSKGLVLGTTLVTADGTELNYNDGATPGTVVASKTVVVDENKDISSFRNLTATNLTGTLQTAAQPNVTSVGTLSSLAVAGDVTVGTTTLSEAEVAVLDTVTPGTASASKALVVDANKSISGVSGISASQLTLVPSSFEYLQNGLTASLGANIGQSLNSSTQIASSPTLKMAIAISKYSEHSANVAIMTDPTGFSTQATPFGTMSNPYPISIIWHAALAKFVIFYQVSDAAYSSANVRYVTSSNGYTWSAPVSTSLTIMRPTSIQYFEPSGHAVFFVGNKFYYSADNSTWTSITLINALGDVGEPNVDSLQIIGNYVTHRDQAASSTANVMNWSGSAWTQSAALPIFSGFPKSRAYDPTEDRLYMTNVNSINTATGTLAMSYIDNVSTLPVSSWTSSVQSLNITNVLSISYFSMAYMPNYGVCIYGIKSGDIDPTNSGSSARFLQIKNKALAYDFVDGPTENAAHTYGYNGYFSRNMFVDWNNDLVLPIGQYGATVSTLYATPSGVASGLVFGSTTLVESEMAVLDAVTAGTASASKALVVDSSKNISGVGNFGAANITSTTGSLTLGATTISETEAAVLDSVVPGTVLASHAVVVDANKDISSFRNLTSTNLTSTAGSLTMGATDISESEIAVLDSAVAGTASASKALVVDASKNIAGINSVSSALLTSTGGSLTMGATNISEAEIGVLDSVTPGTVLASHAVVVDGNKDVSSFRNLTAVTLAASAGSLTMGGTTIDETEIGYLDGTIPGTATAFKALVPDSNDDITGLHALTATDLNATTLTIDGVTYDATSMDVLDGVVHGQAAADKAVILDATKSISGLGDVSADTLTLVDGSLTMGATNISEAEVAVLDTVVPGTVLASHAVVVDANKDISAFRNLTATNLTGTLQTAAQPNVTSVGTLTSLAVAGDVTVGATTLSENEVAVLDTVVPGTVLASHAVVVDGNKDVSSFRNLTATNLTGTLQTAAQPNVTSVTTLDITGHDGMAAGLSLGGTLLSTSAAEINSLFDGTSDLTVVNETVTTDINLSGHDGITHGLKLSGSLVTANATEMNYLDGATRGHAIADKALIFDENVDVDGIHALTAAQLTGQIQTASQPLITSVATLDITGHDGAAAGLSLGGVLLTATAAQINSIFGAGGEGTFNNLTVNDTLTLGGADGSSKGLVLGTTLVTADGTELNYNDGATPGTVVASKTVVVDENKDISAFRNLTATNLTGTLQTAAQPNVTSVGTLSSLAVAGDVTVGATTLSEAEVAVLDTVVPGTVLASHAVVVDENKDISAFRNLTATNLTGTLQTAAQPNVTSVGTLTTLAVTGDVDVGGNLVVGGTFISESEILALDAAVPGTATANKAMVTDASNSIGGVNAFSATSITGTLQTAAQPNVTSVGTLTSLAVAGDVDVGGNLVVGGTFISEAEILALDAAVPGTATANKAMITDANNSIGGVNAFTATSITGTLQTAAQPNIKSVATLDITAHDGSTEGLELNGTLVTASATELNYVDTTPGAAQASKALVVDADKNIAGVNAFSTATVASTATTDSTDTATGAIVTAGGVGIAKALNVGTSVFVGTDLSVAGQSSLTGDVILGSETDATSATSGALTVAGGVGIAKDAYVGEDLHVLGSLYTTGAVSQSGILHITDATQSTATTNGAVVVDGGVGVAKNINVGGNASIAGTFSATGSSTLVGDIISSSITESSSTTTGALTVAGGVGIAKKLNVGGDASVAGAISITGTTTATGAVSVVNSSDSIDVATGALTVAGGVGIAKKLFVGSDASIAGAADVVGALTVGSTADITGDATVGGKATVTGSVEGASLVLSSNDAEAMFKLNAAAGYVENQSDVGYQWMSGSTPLSAGSKIMELDDALSTTVPVVAENATDASSTTTGALTVAGGVGIAKKLFVGSDASIAGAVSITGNLSQTGSVAITNSTDASDVDTGSLTTDGGVGIAKKLFVGSDASIAGAVSITGHLAQTGSVAIADTTESTSTTTGSLTTAGGAGVAKSLHVGGDVVVAGTITASGPMNQNGALTISDTTDSTSTTTGAIITAGGVGIAKSVHVGGAIVVESNMVSAGNDSGAIVVHGGVGVSSDVNVGGDVDIDGDEYLHGDFNLYGQLNTTNVNWTPDASSPFDTDPLTVITDSDSILAINRGAGIGYLYNTLEVVVVPNIVTAQSVLYHGAITDNGSSWGTIALAGDAATTFAASYAAHTIVINQIVVRPWSDKIWAAGALSTSGSSVAIVLTGTVATGLSDLYIVGETAATADVAATHIAVATDDGSVAVVRYVSASQADIFYINVATQQNFASVKAGNFQRIDWLGGLGRFVATRADTSAICTSMNIAADVWVDGTTPAATAATTVVFNTTLNLAIAVGEEFIWYSTNGFVWSACEYTALASGKTFSAVVNSPVSALVSAYTQDQIYYTTDAVHWTALAMTTAFGPDATFTSAVAYDADSYAYALALHNASTSIQKIGPVAEASRIYRTLVSGGYMKSDSAAGYKWFYNSTGASDGDQLMRLASTSLDVTPAIAIASTTDSLSTATGALKVAGGVGIAKSLTVGADAAVTGAVTISGATTQGGAVSITNVTDASSITTGALKVAGGVGIAKKLFVGSDASIGGALSVTGIASLSGALSIDDSTETISPTTGALKVAGGVGIAKSLNVGINAAVVGDFTVSGASYQNTLALTSTTDASSSTTGAFTVAGGAGIAQKLFVGSDESVQGALTVGGGATISGAISATNDTDASSITTGALKVAGGVGIAKKLFVGSDTEITGMLSVGDLVAFADDTDASSTTTGALRVAGGAGIAKKLYVGGGIYGTIETAAQPNIASVTTLDITGHDGATAGLKLGGSLLTSSASELNYLDGSQVGTVVAGKAIVADLSRDVSNINSLSATSLTGTIQTAAQPNITSVNTLDIALHDGTTTGLSLAGVLLTATAAQLNSLFAGGSDLTAVNATITDTLTLSGANGTDAGLVLGSTLVTSSGTQLNYVNTTPGTAEASKALVFDANTSIAGINSLSATSLTGTIQTAAQPNITSVTTLNITGHDGSTAGLQLGGALVTSTGVELNYVDTTPGTAEASKALVFDASKNITGINALSATSLTGTIQTAAQPNITSVGSLTSLAIANAGTLTLGATEISETDIAKIDGITNGTAAASKALVLDASKNISGINSLSSTSLAIGTPANSDLPVEIGFTAYQFAGEFAYSNSANSHGITNAGDGETANYSLRADGRILVTGEVEITSDRRMKDNITELSADLSKRFVMQARPVSFNWKTGDAITDYGYIAQEVYKLGFTDLVTVTPHPGMEEVIDEDGFINPKDAKFVFSPGKITPMLALNQRSIFEQLEEKDAQIARMEERLAALEAAIAKML